MQRLKTMKAARIFSVIFFLLGGCIGKEPAGVEGQANLSGDSPWVRYAQGFNVSSVGNAKLVSVTYPFQGATAGYSYLLVPRGEDPPTHAPGTKIIYIPLDNIVCTSTTHIPLLDYLGETDRLVGFPTTDYISSEKMRSRIDAGEVTDLGVDKGLNMERLALLKPGAVMGYTMSGDYGQFRKIESLGTPVVINAEYLERHPLGRAEWIKFMALFFNKEDLADSVFNVIEENYNATRAIAANAAYKPTVLSGIVYGDAWFLPGGQNYAAQLFRDAGYRYLWEDTESNGFIQLPFELVYSKAHNANLWVGTGTFGNLAEIRAADHRYSGFDALQKKNVYNYDARQGARGGNEFLELGYLRPDLILMDLVKIAHPDLLPDHKLFFHRRLE